VPQLRFPGFNGEWACLKLNDFAERVTRKNGSTSDIPLTISAQHGLIDQRTFFSKAVASADMSGYYLLKNGEFAYNRSSSGEFPFGSIKRLDQYKAGAVSTLYICFGLRDQSPVSDFVKWYFDSSKWHREAGLICAEGARNHGLLNVPTAGFFNTIHHIPANKDEQKKIASFLSLVDRRLTAQRRLVELLKKHKRGLHSAIFGQKCRVVNDDGKPWPVWRQVRIGDIFQERSERGGTADELLSVTINNGVRRQADTDKKDSSSEDKSNYKKVLPGDIVYNTMRMWQGASGVSPWAGIVSPAYTVIYPLGRQNTIFWAYAFKYWRLIQEFQKFSQGLTSDTWNLKYPQLSDIRVYEPSMDEQEAIANILSMLDGRVMAAEQELNKMRNLKSGLLQQLFV